MYTKVNILNELELSAEKFIMDNDRMLYKVFFEAVEQFCASNLVLLGGRIGIDLITGKALSRTSFFWDLYCDDTFNTAKNLVIKLSGVRSPHIPANTVALQTNIRHKEFTIYINARTLFKVYSMDKYRGIKLIDLMGPAVRTSYFARIPIKCIPEEMQLITIYRNLYTPSKMSLWRDDIENERKIYELIRESASEKATQLIGSNEGSNASDSCKNGKVGDAHSGPDTDSYRAADVTGAHQYSPHIKQTINCILQKVLRANDYVLIGEYALSALKLTHNPLRLQFIAHDDIKIIVKKCERCLARPGKLTYMYYSLNLPDDFQILKYTIYMSTGKDQVALADVFNSSAFEMIPFTWRDNVRVGNLWVILRFLFIDMWVLKLILNLDSNSAEFIKTKIVDTIKRADIVRTNIAADMPVHFQIDNYVGRYIDENIAKKKLIKEIGERLPIFYPAKHILPGGAQEPRRYRSGKIDLSSDVDTKYKILMKIVGVVINGDILQTLHYYAQSGGSGSKWGVGKTLKGFFYKNAQFIKYIPPRIENYVDIGCGDGLDIAAVKQKYQVGTATCVDIADFRDEAYKNSEFIKVDLNKPLALADNHADLVTIFHSLHHMQDDVFGRLADITRITRPGGLIFIKDHDVDSAKKAGNVDFEHLVYMVLALSSARQPAPSQSSPSSPVSPPVATNISNLVENFHKYEPMTYYSRAEINAALEGQCELLWTGEISQRTYIYGSVFRKK